MHFILLGKLLYLYLLDRKRDIVCYLFKNDILFVFLKICPRFKDTKEVKPKEISSKKWPYCQILYAYFYIV